MTPSDHPETPGRLAKYAAWLDRLFTTDGFRGPVLTLLTGSGIVFVLGYLAQGVITRIYTPDEVGISKFFVTLMAVVGSFASLRYEDALMLPERDEDAAVLVWLSGLVLASTTALVIVALIWSDQIAILLRFPAVAPYLPLIPLTLVLMRVGNFAEFWLVRKRAFRHITAGHVSLTAAMVSGRIGAGAPPIRADEAGMIGGFVGAHFLASALMVWLAVRRSWEAFRAACRWTAIRAAARRYRRFALFSTPSAMIGVLVGHMVVFLIPRFFESIAEAEVGFYGSAFAAIGIPMSFVARSVAHVFFVSAAEAELVGKLAGVTTMVHRRLIMIALFPTLAVMLGGPDFFELWLGKDWRQAGIYAAYVAPWLVFSSVASPLTRIYDVKERQRVDFAMATLMLLVLTGALVVGARTGSVANMLIGGGIAGAAVRLIQIGVMLHLAGVTLRDALTPYRDYALLSLPGLALIAAATLASTPWLTTVSMAAGAAAYAVLIARREGLNLSVQ